MRQDLKLNLKSDEDDEYSIVRVAWEENVKSFIFEDCKLISILRVQNFDTSVYNELQYTVNNIAV